MNDCGYCLLCASPCATDIALCTACRDGLPRIHQPCPRCAIPLPPSLPPGSMCGSCQIKAPAFDRCHALCPYVFPLPELISRFKFQGLFSSGAALASLLGTQLLPHWKIHRPDALIPVPLHPARLRTRGFNQSLELARRLASSLRLHVEPGLCLRMRNTPAQKGLDATERAKNLRGAFQIKDPPVRWQYVVLVDDVVTTMTTVNEIAALLKQKGILRVEVACLARVEAGRIRTDT
ncbi:MAG: ComF family protein [Pseudomonadales bacterium]|nr:ComF family protein [Pseudomonadales bacterium]